MLKLYERREKGGLSLPDPRLYSVSFEMAKLVIYWGINQAGQEWLSIESEIYTPFDPKGMLSQSCTSLNPILFHSSQVWLNIHRILKISPHVQFYSSL